MLIYCLIIIKPHEYNKKLTDCLKLLYNELNKNAICF
jgi:hypothetical protein